MDPETHHMKGPRQIVLDESALKRWQEEAERLTAEINRLVQRRNVLLQRIQSFPLFFEDSEKPALLTSSPQIVSEPQEREVSLPAALRSALGSVPKPISKVELRARVLKDGIPEAKLGMRYSYFYTVLQRMIRSGEVAQGRNGKVNLVGRPEKPQEGRSIQP